MTTVSQFRIGLPTNFVAEDVCEAIAKAFREQYWFKPQYLPAKPSRDLLTQYLHSRQTRIPLGLFVQLLQGVERMGDRHANGAGREWVRRILQIIAEPFGLDVIPRRKTSEETKPLDAEELDVHRAVSRLSSGLSCLTAETREQVIAETFAVENEVADIRELIRRIA